MADVPPTIIKKVW